MELFSKMLFTALLALDVIFVLSCVLLLAGIAGTRSFRTFNLLQNNLQTLEQCESFRHLLMLPWLVFTAGGIIVQITLVISFMIAVADYGAVAIFLGYENQCKIVTKWEVVDSKALKPKRRAIKIGLVANT